MAATIDDVKKLLLRGLDPRNTVNRLGAMLKDEKVAAAPAKEEEAPEPAKPEKSGKFKKGKK